MFNFLEKKLINLLIIFIAVACLVFLLFEDYLKLSGYLISIILIILPGYLQANWRKFQNLFSVEIIVRTQLIFAFVSFLNLLGSLAFYHYNQTTWWYDSFIHFINPLLLFCLTPILPMLWQYFLFKKTNLIFTIALNFSLAILFSFAWEFYEGLIDSLFSSAIMFGQDGELLMDTLTDLSADFFSAVAASVLLYNNVYGYLLKRVNFAKIS